MLLLVAIPVQAAALAGLLANLDFGRRLIEDQTASLTGGMVRITGLAGRFPDALRADRIQVSDAKGPYVTVTGLALDWSPAMLLKRVAQIDRLTADSVDLARLPESGSTAPAKDSGGSFTLPVTVELARLQVDKASIGAPVAGTAATLALIGSGELRALTEGTAHLTATRLDAPGAYRIDGDVTPAAIQAAVTVNEPAQGLVSSIAKLPDLGQVALQASVNGPRDALAAQVGLAAGPLKASVSGTIDLEHQAADLTVSAQAPAMRPAPGIGWRSILVNAAVHGPFTKPDASGTVRIDGLTAQGAGVGSLSADIKGNSGQVDLRATAAGVHVPGPDPDILAADPVVLDVSARLDAPDRPVTFALRHKLVTVTGSARTAGEPSVQAHLDLPDLAPLPIGLQGRTSLDVTAAMNGDTTTATVKGTVAITGGTAPVPALIGGDGRIDLAASLHGQDATLSHLTVNGKSVSLSAAGNLTASVLDANFSIALADLAAVQPGMAGTLDVKGHAGGPMDNLAAQADIGADLSAKGYRSGRVTAHIDATGLPGAPKAAVTAGGTLLDAPLNLALTADRTNGTLHADIGALSWKSLQAQGNVGLAPGATLPTGQLRLTFARLNDLAPLLGRPIAGAAEASLDADAQAARLSLTARDVSVPGSAVGKAALNLTVTDPAGDPDIDATLTADGVSSGPAKGASARITAKGKLDAIALAVTADAPDVSGGPARLVTSGSADAKARTLALAKLEASWKQQAIRLLAPAKLGFADGVAIDRLRLRFRQAELTVSGSAGRTLDLTASLRNLPADIGAIASPSLAADGTIAADARLTGTSAQPKGTVKLTADGVRLRQGPGRALPAANLTAELTLLGTSARVDTRLTAGPSHVTVTGTAPLSATGALDLRTEGRVDLAMLDPLLAAQGRRARGTVGINATIGGTAAAPQANGTADLANGDVADYAMGAHVTGLNATVQASGDTVRLTSFSGKAGQGTLGGSGTIGLAGQMPVDLHFTAGNATPLSSDLMTATIDADLTVKGEVKGDLQADGTIRVRRADIRIPDKLPASIAVLPVRDPNAPPPPPAPAAPPSQIALNLTLAAPQQVFIRGRGLNAELGGTIHITGTASAPNPRGGLDLRQGTMSLVGSTLTFTEGSISFSGAGIADPSLHFVATSATSSITATLTIGGTASDPKITLSSVPDMPQDEILAQLLFNTSTSKLSPLQLAQIASALATLSGAAGSFDPLDSVRTTLGLDRLSVGSSTSGNPTVEGGRYIARGVYLGAKQSTTGGAPQATVQVDLAKGLKLETTAGSSSSSATGSTGSADAASIGLTYQFEY